MICKACGSWFGNITTQDLCPTCERALNRLKGYAAPVVHGRWITTVYTTTSKRGRIISSKKFECSKCGYSNGRKQSNYCPNCGADMREVNSGPADKPI